MIQQETKGFWPLIKLIPIKTNFRLMRFATPLAIISLASMTLAPLGARIAHGMEIRPLKRIFAVVLYGISAYFLLR